MCFLNSTPRFAEWGFACWDLQRELLLGDTAESQAWDVSFLGLYDDAKVHMSTQETMVGRAMNQWWDTCADAGPRSRPNTAFLEDPPEMELLTINNEQKSVQTLSLQFTIRCFFNSFQTQIGYYDHPNCGLNLLWAPMSTSQDSGVGDPKVHRNPCRPVEGFERQAGFGSSGCKCCQELWLSISVPFHHERTFFSHPENQCFA